MYPRSFAYARATAPEEAIELLAEYGEDARVLAGGMSLVPQMKYRQRTPRVLVDIGRLRELAHIGVDDGALVIGALTRHADVAAWEGTPQLEIVREVAGRIGDRQVRGMGTVGGSLAAVEATGDWGPALLALRGEVVAVSTGSERRIAADDLFVAPLRSSLRREELLTHVVAELPSARFGAAQTKFEIRAGAAFMSCAVCVQLGEEGRVAHASIGCGGLEPIPVRLEGVEALVRGEQPGDELVDAAAATVRDGHGRQAAYRASVAASLLREALSSAVTRAGAAA